MSSRSKRPKNKDLREENTPTEDQELETSSTSNEAILIIQGQLEEALVEKDYFQKLTDSPFIT